MAHQASILLIEDHRDIADMVGSYFESKGYQLDYAADGVTGLHLAVVNDYDAVVLDLMLPGMDGLLLCRKLREEARRDTPLIMLTARDTQQDKIDGLDAGADDYLVKPFSFEELLARIRALLRRPHDAHGDVLTADDLSLDTVSKNVIRDGKPIALSSKEYALLEYLLRNKGKVLSKQNIITHVWDFDADVLPNNVEVFVAYLRNKIERPFSGPSIIKTVRGFGYKIEA